MKPLGMWFPIFYFRSLPLDSYLFTIVCYLYGFLVHICSNYSQLSYHHCWSHPSKNYPFLPVFQVLALGKAVRDISESDLVQNWESVFSPKPEICDFSWSLWSSHVTKSVGSVPQNASSPAVTLGQTFLIYCFNYCQPLLYGSFSLVSPH